MVKRCQKTLDNSDKIIYLVGNSYSFRGLVYYHHGWDHGSMQENTVLEKKLRVLPLYPQAAMKETQDLA